MEGRFHDTSRLRTIRHRPCRRMRRTARYCSDSAFVSRRRGGASWCYARDAGLGTRLGNYTVTAKIGEGGMGTVYLAEHAMLGRRAAIKVLLPQLSNHRDTVARFFNEARAATAIRHPSIVEMFDFGYLPAGS